MTTDNLSLVLEKQLDMQLKQRPVPEPSDYQVLIQMHSVGICGSDVHYWQNGRISDYIVRKPMVLGHESSGTIVKCGSKVTHLKPGDRVAIEPGVPCRRCDQCLIGRYNLCPDIEFCATPPVDGTLCRYYLHDASFCFKLPDHVSMEEGALLEPLAVAVHSCRRAGVGPHSNVLICGAGPIGLVNLLVAKAMGVPTVVITDIIESRLPVAKSFGADETIAIARGDSIETQIKKVTDALGSRPDITIECSGAEPSINLAIQVTKTGGTIQLVGMGAPEIKTSLLTALCKEIDIRGTFRYANCYPTALALVASKKVDVLPLITHRFALEESIKAFETAHKPETGAIKVMIKCQK